MHNASTFLNKNQRELWCVDGFQNGALFSTPSFNFGQKVILDGGIIVESGQIPILGLIQVQGNDHFDGHTVEVARA